jgi:hypothetical protein
VRTEQCHWTLNAGWHSPGTPAVDPQLVFVFGAPDRLRDPARFGELRARYPRSSMVGCSTAGEIVGTQVFDDSIVATAIEFESTPVRIAATEIAGSSDSRAAGQRLAAGLAGDGLAHVLVLSEGLHVNGSDLVAGLASGLPERVAVTGGLAGDGPRFGETLVLHGDQARMRAAVAVGFYGSNIRVGYASLGGWDPFGPERVITRASGNVLFELDGQSALALYKRYLGHHASDLPTSGLLFPLSLRNEAGTDPTVRTILSVDEAAQSMTFAGDMPVGAHARLMKANYDRLIDGAAGAARAGYESVGSLTPDVALLISCVGRKLVLKQRVEEEVEAVREVLGAETLLMGFYSYGEISPFTPGARCQLHNQTMTVTTLAER